MEARIAFEKAVKSGRFVVMISCIDKDTELVHHRTYTENFPVVDFDRVIVEHEKHLTEQRKKAVCEPKREG